MAALTVRCLTKLGYATKNWLREQEFNLPVLAYETSEPPLLYSRVNRGGDEGSRTLIVRFTRPTLYFPIELHRRVAQTLVCD